MSKFTDAVRGLRFSTKSMFSIILTAVLLIATIIVAVAGFTAASTKNVSTTLVSYSLQGNFSQQAYGYLTSDTSPTGGADLVYFPAIIESTTGSYTYEFSSKGNVSDVKSTIQITATLTESGLWSKQIVLVPSQALTEKTVTFAIDPENYLEMTRTIAEELGLRAPSSVDIVFTANVRTEATVDGALIEDDFFQTCNVSLSSTVMEWTRPLDQTRKGYQANQSYEQRGNFGYTITLKDNSLYGAATLTSPLPPVSVLRQLNAADSYQSERIENMNVIFLYNVVADNSISDILHEVTVNAVLSNPDGDQVTFPLIDAEQFAGDLSVNLPIDVSLLYDIINDMEKTTANNFDTTYYLTIRANVHTTASSPGMIDKTMNAALPMTLSADTMEILEVTGNTITDSVTSTTQVPNKSRDSLLLATLSLFCLTLLAGLWTLYQYMESQRTRSLIHEAWENTQQIAAKHKDIFVDVMELPQLTSEEKTMQINSLQELVRISDSLLKPVLHQKYGERHTYCVIDGVTRYIYTIEEPPARTTAGTQKVPPQES